MDAMINKVTNPNYRKKVYIVNVFVVGNYHFLPPGFAYTKCI